MGAKSSTDHGSGSEAGEEDEAIAGGSESAGTSESPSGQRTGERRKHPVDIQYEEEPLLVTDETPNKRRGLSKSKRGRGLHFLGGEIQNVGDTIDD